MSGRYNFENLLEFGKIDVTCWEDDELALRTGAKSGRHPFNELTCLEKSCFPDVATNKIKLRTHLYIRNKILQLWNNEPNVELTWQLTLTRLCEPFNKLKKEVRHLVEFLTRYGYINYGCYFNMPGSIPCTSSQHTNPGKIVVIGAGLAGIATARQLKKFGFEVTVLESLSRIGGRCHSIIQSPVKEANQKISKEYGTDFGPDLISSQVGNPLHIIIKQLSCTPIKISNEIALFDEFGKPMDVKKLDLISEIYAKLCEAIHYLVNVKGIKMLDGEPLSAQKAIDRILAQLELENLKKQDIYWNSYSEVVEKLKTTAMDLNELAETGEALEKRADLITELKENQSLQDTELELLTRFQYVDMCSFSKLNDEARDRKASLLALLKNMKKNEPSAVFMNEKDKRVLDWYTSSAEYFLGTTLDQVPVEFFDPSAADWWCNSFGLRDGLGSLVHRLDMQEIKRGCSVNKIIYDENKVTIKYTKRELLNENDEYGIKLMSNKEADETIDCDAVVCAVPLGVLKKNVIHFEPPLPLTKQDAINKMGFGITNKVVLMFEKAFWPQDTNFFARLNSNLFSRGEFFMFIAVGNKPVLVALIGGSTAICQQSNEVISASVMNIIKNIFGAGATPKQPKSIIITRWHEDPCFYGTNSFIKIGANSEMYDILAEPISAKISSSTKRIFFAGEHTNRQYPATIEGAWLSGVRAAAEIADQFIGQPFGRHECYDIDPQSSEEMDDDLQILS